MKHPWSAMLRIVQAAAILLAAPALAQGQQSTSALAETLFQDGKKLMDAGKYSEACPKLAESQRLDPGGGTLISLAVCHEKEGKLASAWSEFTESLALARQGKRADRERVATDRLAALTPLLSRLTVRVPENARLAGLEVRVDDLVLQPAAWGAAAPVDPGVHSIRATAPGHEPFSTTVTIEGTKMARSIEVPKLPETYRNPYGEIPPVSPAASSTPPAGSAPPVNSSPPPPPPNASPAPRSSPVLGYVVSGIGAAGLLVGGYFGLKAYSDNKRANDLCPDKGCANDEALSKNESAGRSMNIANVGIGIGIVGLGVGAYLVFRPREPSTAMKIAPYVGSGGGGLSAGGGFLRPANPVRQQVDSSSRTEGIRSRPDRHRSFPITTPSRPSRWRRYAIGRRGVKPRFSAESRSPQCAVRKCRHPVGRTCCHPSTERYRRRTTRTCGPIRP